MKIIKPQFINVLTTRSLRFLAFSAVLVAGCSPAVPPQTFTGKSKSAAESATNGVLPANASPVPVLDPLPNVSVRAGENFSVTARARDSEGGALRYTLACPAELGGLKENDSGVFTSSVGSNVVTQEVDCAVGVRNKYLKVANSVFRVSVSGTTQIATSAANVANPSAPKPNNWFNSALGALPGLVGKFDGTAVLGALFGKKRAESRSSNEKGTAPIYDAWNVTPKEFDGFAFDKNIIDFNYQIPEVDYSSAWTSKDFNGFKYNEFFQESNFKFDEKFSNTDWSTSWNTTDLGFNYTSMDQFKNYWPTTGTFGTESLFKDYDFSAGSDTKIAWPTTETQWSPNSWNTNTDFSK